MTETHGKPLGELKNFKLLAKHDITSLLQNELDAYPELWDQHRDRKDGIGSPHSQMSDIWVRFRDYSELTSPQEFNRPHVPVWYPAASKLPTVKESCELCKMQLKADELGGVLITKIPPGGKILPHHDRGGWHAEYYNLKLYVPIRGTAECLNHCEGETVSMLPGEVWSFDNLKVHSVENNSDQDRITLIICLRKDNLDDLYR